jgi:hypothetical protein
LLKDIFKFLKIDENFKPDISTVHNKAKTPRFPKLNYYLKGSLLLRKIQRIMPDNLAKKLGNIIGSGNIIPKISGKDREALLPYFENDIKKLSDLIKRDLSSWLT